MIKTDNGSKIIIQFEGTDTLEKRELMRKSIEKTFNLIGILNSIEN